MKEQFINKRIAVGTANLIAKADEIISDYYAQGYVLTVRQVYYQFVARDLIPNTEEWYKRIVNILNSGRLMGLIDWSAIEDRTRGISSPATWDSIQDIAQSAVDSFAVDRWQGQPNRIEVWVEKDALVGIIAQACKPLQIPYFSCRGYASQSSLYRASKRIIQSMHEGQEPIILHLADHDPSGIDMTRDIRKRLHMFTGMPINVKRIALNIEQVRKYHPPPNPTKLTDTRAKGYIADFGHECWELDALEPKVLNELVTDEVLRYRDPKAWDINIIDEREGKERLQKLVDEL